MASQRFGQIFQHGDYKVSIQLLPGYIAWIKAKGDPELPDNELLLNPDSAQFQPLTAIEPKI